MDLRVLLLTSLLAATALAALAPTAAAAPCDTTQPDVSCEGTVGNCDVEAGANVVTTTAAGGSADCRGGGTGTRCYTAVGVGQTLDPTVERWCAF